MFRVLTCVTTEHDLRLVLLAALICAVATFTSFRIYARATSARALQDHQHRRLVWLGLTGLSTGAGIWSTHFVAMLAYDSGFPTAYDPTLTLTSLVIAIGVTTVGYLIAAQDGEPAGAGYHINVFGCSIAMHGSDAKVATGGAVVGTGIGMMHYTGMAAVIVPGVIQWETPYVVVSLGLGIVLASAGMVANHRLDRRKALWIAPGLLTLAICSLHFTAMTAATVVPDPTIVVHPSVINTVGMAFAVAGVTMLVMLAAVGAALVNAQAEREVEKELRRHNEALQQRDRELEAQNAQLAQQHTLLKQHEAQLQVRNLQLDAALNNMSQGLAMFDAEQRLVVCNRLYAELYGLTPTQVKPGTTIRQLLEYRHAKGVFGNVDFEAFMRDWLAEFSKASSRIQELADGRIISIVRRPMLDGGLVSTTEDITEQRRSEAKIAHMAQHDALTGLPNRVLLNERLELAVARARRGEVVAIHVFDLDRFKNVNDMLGHAVGDKLLKAAADRLRALTRETDTIARIGGDEFAILQVALEQPADATTLAERIIEAISEPHNIDGHQVIVGTSVGIAVGPTDGVDPDQLMSNADLAMYRAKSEERGTFRFFESGMDVRMKARRAMECDLRKALVASEFELYYQPVVNLENDEIIGCEALIRWHHPDRSMISPGEFIPLAEEIGFIVPLGEWAIRQACATAAAWPDDLKVAVNLSPAQFRSPGLVPAVVSALASSGLAPERLELEITETVLLEHNEATLGKLFQLRELGVRIAMDDFGTGYSSLSHLQRFPFDKIKIDRAFVKDITLSTSSLNIVRAVAAMAKGLGMTTTAEGVETQEQLDTVKAEGCTEMQGFLFSKPLPAHQIDHLIGSRHKERKTVTAMDAA